jgi:ABC-type multidrug transport system ATPase subunit
MIRFSNVAFSYRNGEPIFEFLNLELKSGLTLVLGINGCGKSTLLKLGAGVEYPNTGRVFINNHDLWEEEIEARRGLAYLPEYPDLTPYATIREICNLVCRLRGEPLARGLEALRLFGLDQVSNRSIRELSLGQKRRAIFAAAFIGTPKHILLDEPLESMDRRIQDEVLTWVRLQIEAGAVIALVSHRIEPFIDLATQAVGLKDGRTMIVDSLAGSREEKLQVLEPLARSEWS